jgi:crossover junction endodeoxyribonuclease RuvC
VRILGIDPGIANLGLGAVEVSRDGPRSLHAELVRTRASDAEGERLAAIADALACVLTTLRPDAVALEGQFFHRQRDTALKVAQATGVVMLVAHRHEVPVHRYGPLQVKQALVGTGRADKAQVVFMVRSLLGLGRTPLDHHVADALALALTHWSSYRLRGVGAAEATSSSR